MSAFDNKLFVDKREQTHGMRQFFHTFDISQYTKEGEDDLRIKISLDKIVFEKWDLWYGFMKNRLSEPFTETEHFTGLMTGHGQDSKCGEYVVLRIHLKPVIRWDRDPCRCILGRNREIWFKFKFVVC